MLKRVKCHFPPSTELGHGLTSHSPKKNILKLCTNSMPTSVFAVSIINTFLFLMKKIIMKNREGEE